MPHPIYIESADGPYLTDVDGNRYVDLTAGFGPNVLGNRPKVVEQAISDQIKKGWHFGIPGPGQSELAGILKEASPVTEQVVFCNSGSEATMFAFRAARAYTGKQVVALFDGSYHGIHDYALTKADLKSDRSKPRSKVMGAGSAGGRASRVDVDASLIVMKTPSILFDNTKIHWRWSLSSQFKALIRG